LRKVATPKQQEERKLISKTWQELYKEGELQANISRECRCKILKENITKPKHWFIRRIICHWSCWIYSGMKRWFNIGESI
jgi:hypothetical protein